MANANPPKPPNTRLWTKPVSPDMTAWAVSILHDPFDYPMFSETKRVFGGTVALARVEWHDWTYRNGVKVSGTFRGVTLYEMVSGATPGGKLAATSTVEGLDVSHWQGDIDWRKVADAGKAFAFMKATDGIGTFDAAFATNWKRSASAGILRGAYHFFRPAFDAVRQAELFLSQLDTVGELPPVVDVEQADGVAASEIAAGVSAWIDHVAESCGRPIVYTSPGLWDELPVADIETKADLWIVNWSDAAPEPMGGWSNWSFWQYSDKGVVKGVDGRVDLDRFNGTMDQLHAFVTRASSSPAAASPTFDLTTMSGVQGALNYLGASPPLTVDGLIGPRTLAVVRAFQRAHWLVVDGVVGPKTMAALEEALQVIRAY